MKRITGPEIKRRIESCSTLSDARKEIENNLGIKVIGVFSNEFTTTYEVLEGNTRVYRIAVSVNRLTGKIKGWIRY